MPPIPDLEQKVSIIAETRACAAQFAIAASMGFALRSRFNANGAADAFKSDSAGEDTAGAHPFLLNGTGQAIHWDNFIGFFNALGGVEANGAWLALVAQAERTRG